MLKIIKTEPTKEKVITSSGVVEMDSYRVFLQKEDKLLPPIFQTLPELYQLQDYIFASKDRQI